MIGTRPDSVIPTMLCIDVEPDGTDPQPAARWAGFESMVAFTDELRERLAQVTGAAVRFAWFLRLDPQIEALHGSATWLVDRYPAEIERLRRTGDAFGAHTHAWRRADRDGSSAWVADWGNAAWAAACTDRSLTAFAEAFGEPCRIHRFGDRQISADLMAVLAKRGVRVDLTVEPGARPVRAMYAGWHGTGRSVDYAAALRRPYRPSPADPLREAQAEHGRGPDGTPWMIPQTAIDATSLLPRWRRIARDVRYPGRTHHRPVVLWAPGPAGAMWSIIERDLAASPTPYLAFAIRADALLASRSATPLRARLEALLGSTLAHRLRFVDPLAGLAMLRPDSSVGSPQPGTLSEPPPSSAAEPAVIEGIAEGAAAAASASPASAHRGV